MTTVADMWEKKDSYTSRASEIARTLGLSGLAVVWLFRTPTQNASTIAPTLLWTSGLIILALMLDLLQYVVGARRTAAVAREAELKLKAAHLPLTTEVHYPKNHPLPMTVLWRCKITLVVVAWGLLLFYVAQAALHASLPALSK